MAKGRNVPSRAKSIADEMTGALRLPLPLNATEVPSVYSNSIDILSMNHIDVRIAFNEVIIETGNDIRTVRRANIIMPTATFLATVQILSANAQNLILVQQKQVDQMQAHLQSQIEEGLKRAAEIQSA